jgi:hypothetical protein
MPLRPTTIRFSGPIYDFVAHEAVIAGESIAEFVRAAALARATTFYVRRDGPGVDEFFELFAAAREFDRRYTQEGRHQV